MKKTFAAPAMSISNFDCENITVNGSIVGQTAADSVETKLKGFAQENSISLENTTLIF